MQTSHAKSIGTSIRCAYKNPAVACGVAKSGRDRNLLDDRGDDAGAACKSRLRAICTLFAAVGSLRHRLCDHYLMIEAT
ncbi:hypothetical protein, partial [Ensifer aridi]|uniref:hypothetical protein n=1 Tax=Ensifer aridi TaxID=1708715 RepID=UPI001AECE61C